MVHSWNLVLICKRQGVSMKLLLLVWSVAPRNGHGGVSKSSACLNPPRVQRTLPGSSFVENKCTMWGQLAYMNKSKYHCVYLLNKVAERAAVCSLDCLATLLGASPHPAARQLLGTPQSRVGPRQPLASPPALRTAQAQEVPQAPQGGSGPSLLSPQSLSAVGPSASPERGLPPAAQALPSPPVAEQGGQPPAKRRKCACRWA